ncbi:hypothetical protein CY35_08G093900 [Sphagnum magellanicum]|nr:hypothetical protein CY35_08G093900 [Sphagnum magellanicum]
MDLHTTAPCSPSPHSSVKSFVGGPRVPVREEKKKRQKRKEKTHTHTPKLKHTHTHTQIQTHIPDTHTETKERKKGTRKKGHKAKLPTTDCLTDSLRLPLYAIHSFFVVSSIAHFYCSCLLPSYQAPPLARREMRVQGHGCADHDARISACGSCSCEELRGIDVAAAGEYEC